MPETVDLSQTQIEDLIRLRLPEAETVALLHQLKPECMTVDLLHRLIEALRKTVVALPAVEGMVLDCCGTGGSGSSIFNTSTAVAFVLAAGGVPVVKFGNRAMSSASGSFDFLECLGFRSEAPLERLTDMLAQCGVVFLYAPQCYPALAPFNALRKALGFRTVFNFLGPLLHPLKPTHRLLGVSHSGMQQLMADYLQTYQPALEQALLVHHPLNGTQGLDEISPCGATHLIHLREGRQERALFYLAEDDKLPEIRRVPKESADLFMALCRGEQQASLEHRMLCVNAGAGFWIAGKAASIEEGAQLAKDLLNGGKVLETVERCRRAYGE
ncbi:MAG TPA: anthranilate phosphoribosyltransferase [Oculatellaceae cyanobacterium]